MEAPLAIVPITAALPPGFSVTVFPFGVILGAVAAATGVGAGRVTALCSGPRGVRISAGVCATLAGAGATESGCVGTSLSWGWASESEFASARSRLSDVSLARTSLLVLSLHPERLSAPRASASAVSRIRFWVICSKLEWRGEPPPRLKVNARLETYRWENRCRRACAD